MRTEDQGGIMSSAGLLEGVSASWGERKLVKCRNGEDRLFESFDHFMNKIMSNLISLVNV